MTPLSDALISQWHPTKNSPELSPAQLSSQSRRDVWWLGACGHEWEARIESRTRGSGCPYCSGQKVLVGFNDLATINHALAAQWNYTSNLNLTPSEVTAGSRKEVWWECQNGHKYEASIQSRARGRGCPICAGKIILPHVNSLEALNPALAAQWHPTKNSVLTPSEVSAATPRKVWWLGECGHEWEARVSHRSAGSGCPYCAKQREPEVSDSIAASPLLAAQWHATKNKTFNMNEVYKSSGRKIWWECAAGHEWQATPSDRTRGRNCPNCTAAASKPEEELAGWVKSLGFNIQTSVRKFLANRFEVDIYIPELKLAIEFNGLYWHSEHHKAKTYHHEKWLASQRQGVQLIQIWEDDWLGKPQVVKNMLLHKLGVSESSTVGARKTTVVTLNSRTVRGFLNQYHLQGYAKGSHYLGLQANTTGELVAVMVLQVESDETVNIVRYATSVKVQGGFTKLLTHAQTLLNPSAFITFSDNAISDGGLYSSNGFIVDKELPPDYMYVVKGERKHKFGYRLKRFRNDPELAYQDGLTEKELAKLNHLPRIWDAGKTRWKETLTP